LKPISLTDLSFIFEGLHNPKEFRFDLKIKELSLLFQQNICQNGIVSLIDPKIKVPQQMEYIFNLFFLFG